MIKHTFLKNLNNNLLFKSDLKSIEVNVESLNLNQLEDLKYKNCSDLINNIIENKNLYLVNDYKLIDEYKPTGNLIYNENDLLSMKDKINNMS